MDYCKAPDTWDEAADVVIIGSGLAGLAAAAEAARAAKRVIVLEKMPYYGGNSVLAGGGYACWDSKLKMRQKLGVGEDSSQLHFDDTLRGGGYYNIPELVRTLTEGAPSGMDWLVSCGVRFKDVLARVGGNSVPRSYQSANPGKPMMDCVKKMVMDLGVELWCSSEVTGILRDGADGEVLGAEIKRDGKLLRIRARHAVVIASGGFGWDSKLRMEHNPALAESLPCSNHKGATGEMIRFAKAIGADTLHMEFIQLYPCASPKSGSVDRWAFYAYSGTGFGMIYVDGTGKRFVSELAGRDEVSRAQMDKCARPTWAVLNGEIVQALGMTEEEIALGLRLGRMIGADSIEELEARLNIPKGALSDTVDRVNKALENREPDPDFGRERGAGMLPLVNGPFYAIGQWPTVHYTMGGLRIDEKARVIDVFGEPIPRLYAAGEVCGGMHGNNRIGGNSLAECVVFGRIAGENAAAESAVI